MTTISVQWRDAIAVLGVMAGLGSPLGADASPAQVALRGHVVGGGYETAYPPPAGFFDVLPYGTNVVVRLGYDDATPALSQPCGTFSNFCVYAAVTDFSVEIGSAVYRVAAPAGARMNLFVRDESGYGVGFGNDAPGRTPQPGLPHTRHPMTGPGLAGTHVVGASLAAFDTQSPPPGASLPGRRDWAGMDGWILSMDFAYDADPEHRASLTMSSFVPEPATWASMLAGLLLLGALGARRRAAGARLMLK